MLKSESVVADRVSYKQDGQEFESVLLTRGAAYDAHTLMLLVPNFTGMNTRAVDRGKQFAEVDRDVFVVDIYGAGTRPKSFDEAFEAMQSLEQKPLDVRRRMIQALDVARQGFQHRHGRRPSRVAAIGFCFGGGNVLELARSGADVDAVVSIHGSLLTGLPAEMGTIKAPILIAHGAADPVVPKSHRDAIEQELTDAGAKWSMLVFGGVRHAYTDDDMPPTEASAFDAHATAQTYKALEEFIRKSSGYAESS